MTKRPTPKADIVIQNCTFTTAPRADILALAEAIKANAEAIQALCNQATMSQLTIGKVSEDT